MAIFPHIASSRVPFESLNRTSSTWSCNDSFFYLYLYSINCFILLPTNVKITLLIEPQVEVLRRCDTCNGFILCPHSLSNPRAFVCISCDCPSKERLISANIMGGEERREMVKRGRSSLWNPLERDMAGFRRCNGRKEEVRTGKRIEELARSTGTFIPFTGPFCTEIQRNAGKRQLIERCEQCMETFLFGSDYEHYAFLP